MSTFTTTEPTSPTVGPDWVPSPLYRITLEQYEAMIASGAFTKRDRVHLIRGLLVAKMTQKTPHSTADLLCGDALERTIPPGWHVRPAKPIRIAGQASKPEPDRSVARGEIRDYSRHDPEPGDVALVVEVADSRLREARDLAGVCGGGGIAAYWIVNLVDRQVELYSDPFQGGYRSRVEFKPSQAIPVVIDGRQVGTIAVDDVLP
jgi:Uma2 family endonuclease